MGVLNVGKTLSDIFGLVYLVATAVITHEDRATAIAAIKAKLAEPGGVDLPAVLHPIEDWLIGSLLDLVELAAAKVGLGGSTASPQPVDGGTVGHSADGTAVGHPTSTS